MPGHLVQQAECAPHVDADGIETRVTIVHQDRAPAQEVAMGLAAAPEMAIAVARSRLGSVVSNWGVGA